MSTQSATETKRAQTFEFTKRKRWADLLVTELADVIVLVLSPAREILYCGNAVAELLGWRVIDLIDRDLLDLVPSPDDQLSLCSAFQHSIATKLELLSYLRFRTNSPSVDEVSGCKELLFELKGYPHFVNDECRCFFATARPYPSRNASMLNTFLELKMEHERLQQRLCEAQSQIPPQSSGSPSGSGANYATSTIPSQRLHVSGPSLEPSPLRYAPPSANYENLFSGSCDILESANYGLHSHCSSAAHPEEEFEEGAKKKKLKKSHPSEQYVCITCGRTDSPEWRKGPLGPKTLCNACGLRWAKQIRKYDEPAEGPNSS